MKKYLIVASLTFFVLCEPSPMSNGQTKEIEKPAPEIHSILDVLEAKKQRLFKIAFANQDSIEALAKKSPKTVVVEKIRYVKVYKTVPIYVPEHDSISYAIDFPEDTVENSYFITTMPIPIVPVKSQMKSRSYLSQFFYNIFHNKSSLTTKIKK